MLYEVITTSLWKPLTLFSKDGIAEFNAKYPDSPGVPYYFGSRAVFYRSDIYEAAGVEVPTTLEEYTEVNASMLDQGLGGAVHERPDRPADLLV